MREADTAHVSTDVTYDQVDRVWFLEFDRDRAFVQLLLCLQATVINSLLS
jgi:hypothetical protein